MGSSLVGLPTQPPGVPCPKGEWPQVQPPPEIDQELTALLDATFAEPQPATTVQTNAMVVVHGGSSLLLRRAQRLAAEQQQGGTA